MKGKVPEGEEEEDDELEVKWDIKLYDHVFVYIEQTITHILDKAYCIDHGSGDKGAPMHVANLIWKLVYPIVLSECCLRGEYVNES